MAKASFRQVLQLIVIQLPAKIVSRSEVNFKLAEGQTPPPRNHTLINRIFLMKIMSSFKVGKKHFQ